MSFCVDICVSKGSYVEKQEWSSGQVRAMISSIAEGLNFGRSNLGLGNCHLRTCYSNTEKEDSKIPNETN